MTLVISNEAALIGRDLDLDAERVRRTIELLDEGNTIPFITRYRRDVTGAMDEEQIRAVKVALERCRALAERKATILKSIEAQGKLTDEIRSTIEQARSIKRLEDLYLPFKPKKQTLATLARQRGLEPLAIELLAGAHSSDSLAQAALSLVRVDRGLTGIEEIYQGIGHLVAEKFGEDVELRSVLRRWMWRTGRITTTAVTVEPNAAPAAATQSVAMSAAATDSPAVESGAELGSGAVDQGVEGAATEPVGLEGSSTEASAAGGSGPESVVETESHDFENEVEDAADDSEDHAEEHSEDDSEESDDDDEDDSEAETDAESAGDAEGTEGGDAAGDMTAASTDPSAVAAVAAGEKPTEAKGKKKAKRRSKGKKKGEQDAFADYFSFSESLDKLPPHRVLAINRGERARAIRVRITFDEGSALEEGVRKLIAAEHPQRDLLIGWLEDAMSRLIVPSLEREIRRELTERAELHAVSVFARNLRNLLLQPPVRGRRLVAVDPGYKSGCKIAVLDDTGNLVESHVVFVVGNADRRRQGRAWLAEAIRRHQISVVAIGNGTASREVESLIADMLDRELANSGVAYVMVNEAGASVYSTSPVGREELPTTDPTIRSAISIGRRLLDPLSELVKISAENLGVGLYQHDIKAKHLRESLDAVVESCVNFVGVDANTSSPALLRYVSGLNQLSARRFVEYRTEHGPFLNRSQFSNVPGFGDATFVQAAGFLKIADGAHPFDATWIHPESYSIAEKVIDSLGYSLEEIGRILASRSLARTAPAAAVARPAPVVAGAASQVSSESATEAAPANAPESDATEGESLQTQVSETPAAETPLAEVQSAESTEAIAAGVSEPTRAPVASAVEEPEEDPVPPAVALEAWHDLQRKIGSIDVDRMAHELGTGTLLVRDILANLLRPGRDPRESLPPPVFRTGATRIDDLEPGMALAGRILNVVDFGVFVDIGLAESGLVHISHLARDFIKDPHQRFAVGQPIGVWVLSVDKQRRRVGLTAIDPNEPMPQRRRPERGEGRGERGGQERGGQERGGQERGGQERGGEGRPQNRRDDGGAGQGENRRPGGDAGRRPPQRPPQQGGRRPAPSKYVRPPRTHETRPPKPVVPLAPEVAEGKAPMRSFTELLQFYHKKRDES